MTDTRHQSHQKPPGDLQAELHPTAGARFLFEHVPAQAGDETNKTEETEETEETDRTNKTALLRAHYRAAVFTPEERFDYEATLDADGSIALAATDTPAPAELERKLGTIAKVMARDAHKNRELGLPPWPHRVLRWRGPR